MNAIYISGIDPHYEDVWEFRIHGPIDPRASYIPGQGPPWNRCDEDFYGI